VFTLILPYYRSPQMLRRQMEVVADYPPGYTVVVVDDGSPEPAEVPAGVELYRIEVDIPWNRGGARNLGAHVARTDWIIQTDIDHVLLPECAAALLETEIDPACWYRFLRFRHGQADETRRKDTIPRNAGFGPVKPHIDSYLMRRELFLSSPYDEDYSGCLGGGSPFLARMEKIAPVKMLPRDVHLHVYTRHAIADASVSTLSRDTSEYVRRRRLKERRGNTQPGEIMRFDWHRVC